MFARAAALFVLALALLPPGEARAEKVYVEIDTTKPGKIMVNIDPSGVVTANPTKVVVPNGTPTDPTDPTDPQPNPPFRAGIKLLTQQALAAGGTKNAAAGLSAVYSLAADRVPATDPGQIMDLVSTLSGLAVGDEGAKWAAWREKVSQTLAQLQRDDLLNTKDQWVGALRDIHNGLDDAIGVVIDPNALSKAEPKTLGLLDGIFDPEKLAKLIELIKLFISLFELFKPVVPALR